jgi:hypothetical protein
MTKTDRLSHIIELYLEGTLELNTTVAELTHAYMERGWRFALVEEECEPRHRERMRVLVERLRERLPS